MLCSQGYKTLLSELPQLIGGRLVCHHRFAAGLADEHRDGMLAVHEVRQLPNVGLSRSSVIMPAVAVVLFSIQKFILS